MRQMTGTYITLVVFSQALLPGYTQADEPKDAPRSESESKLAMTPAVACRAVTGYEDYEPLPGAALTSEEKLVVYYRPTGFETARDGRKYKAHLTQDGRIRLRGSKTIVRRKDKLIDHEPKSEQPFMDLYVQCIISLKGLKPGEYELDIILHDEIAKGPPATQTLKFKVIPAATFKSKNESEPR